MVGWCETWGHLMTHVGLVEFSIERHWLTSSDRGGVILCLKPATTCLHGKRSMRVCLEKRLPPKFTVIWPFSFLNLLFWEETMSSPFSGQPVGRQKFLDMAPVGTSARISASFWPEVSAVLSFLNTPTTQKKVPGSHRMKTQRGVSYCFSQPVWISNCKWGKWSWHSNEFEKDTVAPRNRLFPLNVRERCFYSFIQWGFRSRQKDK